MRFSIWLLLKAEMAWYRKRKIKILRLVGPQCTDPYGANFQKHTIARTHIESQKGTF